MTKTRSTKRALLMSALALIMCVSMLIGSTYAWFTDSVTSANNKIVSGKLEIKLYNWVDNDWHDISVDNAPLFTDNVLWEPGFMQSKLLKVENAGNLALKWQAQFISDTALSPLADAIDVYVCDGATELATTDRDLTGYTKVGSVRKFINTISTTTVGQLEENGDYATLGLVLKMREDAGNEYQNLTLGNFDIRIFATQLSYEGDSFGTDYDTGAGATMAATMTAGQPTTLAFPTAPSSTAPETSIEIPAGAYEGKKVAMTVTPSNSLFNISASGAVVGTLDVAMSVDGVKTSEQLDGGKVYTVTTYISKGLEGVTVSYTGTDGKDQPTLVSYGPETGELVFTTNHFSEYAVSGKALAYNIATDTALTDVVEILETQTSSNAVVVPQVNAEAFAAEVQDAIEEGLVDENTIDKNDIYPVKVDSTYYTTLADAIAAADGKTVTVLKDMTIDADNTITIPAGTTIILNLNGKTVAGITDDADKNDDGNFTSADNEVVLDVRGTLTVKNGTITIEHKADNFGWNACTEIFYVGFNGTLNVENATLENLGGSAMAYAIDLVNASGAQGVTVNINNSTIKSSYIPVRVFNNGAGMNNVTIKNSNLLGVSRALWVHIYSNKDNGGKGVKDATLNLDIFGNGNTFTATNLDRIIEFGFDDEINFTADGKQLVTATTLSTVMAAAKKGNVIIDAQGATLGDFYYDGTFGNGTVLKNAKFTYAYGVSIDGEVTFENCEFVSDHSYSANFSDGSYTGRVIFNNCLFDGWNSFGEIVTNVEMNNCTFKWTNPYSVLRFYQDAQLNNCVFEKIEGIDTNKTGTTVEFSNCTGIDGKIFNNGSAIGVWIVNGVEISESVTSW